MAYKKGILGKVLYWFFYIPMATIIILFFVIMPNRVLETAVQPIELDAAITKEMLFQRMSVFSFPYGTEFSKYHLDNSSARLYLSNKRFGYKISNKNAEFFGNKDFFIDAKPLAGYNYKEFMEKRNGITVDLLYPKKYEAFERS